MTFSIRASADAPRAPKEAVEEEGDELVDHWRDLLGPRPESVEKRLIRTPAVRARDLVLGRRSRSDTPPDYVPPLRRQLTRHGQKRLSSSILSHAVLVRGNLAFTSA
jgi:hypothetical protein